MRIIIDLISYLACITGSGVISTPLMELADQAVSQLQTTIIYVNLCCVILKVTTDTKVRTSQYI